MKRLINENVRYALLLRTFFVCGLLFFNSSAAQITVTANHSAAELAEKLAGQGVTILNPTMYCAGQANGFFNSVSSNLGLDSGIVLTTGRAATGGGAFGVNGYSFNLASNDNGYPGDATLNVLAGQQTMDACKLEFDVIPDGDTISIDYVFSSEEYISAVCGPYNDAFAFFISGPGIPVTDNMALVPGTTIPVTINSINNGMPGSQGNIANCTSMGAGSPFTAYYRDNATGTALTHKGLTTVLKAMHPVTPCGKYHLRIVIADAGNAKYDSGVFLAAGSLKTGDYTVRALPPPVALTTMPYCIKGCLPGRFRVKRTKPKSLPQAIHYTTGGTALSGVDYAALTDSVIIPAFDTTADIMINGLTTVNNGTKTVKLLIYSPSVCGNASKSIDSAVMLIYDTIHIAVQPRDTLICGGDTVKMDVSGDSIYQYSWQPDIYISDKNSRRPLAYPDADIIYTVTAELPGAPCPFRTATAGFTIRPTPHVFLNTDTTVCFDATVQFAPVVMPFNSFYSYQWTGPDGYIATGSNPVVHAASSLQDGLYQLVVTNDTNGCQAKSRINVAVNIPDTPVVQSPVYFCLNSQPLFFGGAGTHYLWYSSQNGTPSGTPPELPTNAVAGFRYFITQIAGNCESPKKEVQVFVKKCCDGDIFIPTGFTPNGDGENDIFRPVPDYGYILKSISVYDRWGREVFNANTGGWNGNTGATAAPLGTYFYRMVFGCILGGTEERSGDITLIR